MPQSHQLLGLLADGRFHSGEDLARTLSVSRTAVWKTLGRLREQGLDIQAVSGRGYRLVQPVQLLDAERIRARLDADVRQQVPGIEVHLQLPSTNARLMTAGPENAPSGHVCLAEKQTAGRGRRGRVWQSPFGGNIYMSFVRDFDEGVSRISGAALVVALGVARALEATGVTGVGLKWPNDILCGGHKLAGILLEVSSESGGACRIVAGLGLNVHLPAHWREDILQPVTDLGSLLAEIPDRDALVASLINHIYRGLDEFAGQGLESLLPEWRQRDIYHGRPVSLVMAGRSVRGTARGINEYGELILEQEGGIRRSFSGGELSLRPADSGVRA